MRVPKVTKKQNYVFSNESCITCVHKNQCIRCSSLNQPLRKILLSCLGFKQKQNKFMAAGTKRHEIFFGHLKELDEYGVQKFFRDLYSGKEIKLKEISICSPSWGLRGHIDAINLTYDPKDKSYNFIVVELKPSFSKDYIYQIAGYTAILTDPLCKIVYKKKIRKQHFITRNLYPPTVKPYNINIVCKFVYYKTGKEYTFNGASGNQRNKVTNCLPRRIKISREFMKAGVHWLSNYPECSWCKSNIDCDFRDICQRYPYEPKARQMKLGKKKLLIK